VIIKLKTLFRIIPVVIFVASVAGSAAFFSQNSSAVTGTDWKSGKIIEDSIFFNNNAMSVGEIQGFLNSAVPNCDTWGNMPSEYGGGTRAQYGATRGWPAPYVCVRDYIENPSTKENNLRTAAGVNGGISAAQIIKNASDQYGISPKALIILLQKEQTLITDTWPLHLQYRSATGYGCPDTAACDSTYYGFYNQVMNAARQFRLYANNASSYRYKPLQTNTIYYNPVASCGNSQVYIQNYATAGLYNYTPYQPNSSALNNLYGSGDSCGAYGNRNFWRMYNDWFGSTSNIEWANLQDQRWMELAADTYKVDPSTGQQTTQLLRAGQQVKLTTKTTFKNDSCLRTANDTNNGLGYCIPISKLREVRPTYTALTGTNKIKSTKSFGYKVDIVRDKNIESNPITSVQQIEFAATTKIGDTTYYVTNHDYTNGFLNGIPENKIQTSTAYTAITPVWLQLINDRKKQTPNQGTLVDDIIKRNSIVSFNSRVAINNVWHYRTEHDTSLGLDKAIPETQLTVDIFKDFLAPRWMELRQNTNKVDPFNGIVSNAPTPQGTILYFTSKVDTGDGKTYFRTQDDETADSRIALDSTQLIELPFRDFLTPRWMKVALGSKVVNPFTQQVISTVPQNTQIQFVDKITVKGIEYYRDAQANAANTDQAIRITDISEVTYEDFLYPRSLKLKSAAYKQVPSQGINIDARLTQGLTIKFSSKIEVNGQTYFRTANDALYGLDKAILASSLEEL